MGSKGGGPLNVWLREFMALVFTQTIQAFIYAIVISVILYGMQPRSDVSATDNNAALGLMSTFALLSVFKVEALAKQIFGVGESKASTGNAMKSIAKTAIAAQMGKRVLDNAGKVFGGIRQINKSRQDNRKTRARLEEDMADNGFKMGKDGKPEYVGGTASTGGVTSKARAGTTSANAQMSDAQRQYYNAALEAKANGDMDGYKRNRELAAAVRKGENASFGTSSAPGGDVISDAAKRRMKNALRSYEDRLAEIKRARNEGVKSIASGLTEGVASTFGGVTGAVIGGADGNLDEALQGMGIGAGIGDTVAVSAVEAVDKAAKFIERNYNRQAGISNRELKKSIDSYKKAVEDMNIKYGVNDIGDI